MKPRMTSVFVVVLLVIACPWLSSATVADVAPDCLPGEPTLNARIDASLEDGPVLLLFYSTHCAHCDSLAPTIRALEQGLGGAISVLRVDVDEYPGETLAFGVGALPTMMVVTGVDGSGYVQTEIEGCADGMGLMREARAIIEPDRADQAVAREERTAANGASPAKPVRIGYCTSCSDCSSKLAGGSYDIVKLTRDLKQIGGSCVGLVLGESNVVFDCDGHTIDGDDIAIDPDTGVAMMHGSGNTVRNCTIRDFSRGIYLVDATNHTVTDNTLTSNGSGLRLSYSDSTDVEGNTIEDNHTGIRIASSNNNDISGNRVCGNEGADFSLESGAGNTGDSNTCDAAGGWNDTGTTGCTYRCEGYHLFLPLVMQE